MRHTLITITISRNVLECLNDTTRRDAWLTMVSSENCHAGTTSVRQHLDHRRGSPLQHHATSDGWLLRVLRAREKHRARKISTEIYDYAYAGAFLVSSVKLVSENARWKCSKRLSDAWLIIMMINISQRWWTHTYYVYHTQSTKINFNAQQVQTTESDTYKTWQLVKKANGTVTSSQWN